MTIRRWMSILAMLATLAAPAAVRAQVMSVSVNSAGEFLSQFRVLARQADQASAKQILDGLDALDQAGGLKWLDRTRPLAATVDLVPQKPGGRPVLPAINVFLPVTGRDEFLDGLKALGLAVDDQAGAEGFSHKIAPPGGNAQSAYLLAKADSPAGYVVLTTSPLSLETLRTVKAADLKPTRPGTVLVGLRIDRVPPSLKLAFLNNVKQRNNASRQRKDGENDDQYRGRMAGISFVENGVTSLIRDGREMTLDAAINEKTERFSMTLGLDALPETEMAGALKAFGDRRGRFAPIWREAALTLQGIVPVPDSFRTLIRKSLDEQRARLANDKDKDKAGDDSRMIALMLDALTPTLTGDSFDACLAMGSSATASKAGTNIVLFGVEMKDSEKVEAALREAIAKKPEDRARVTFDHDQGPDGTAIHRVTLDPKQLKPDEFGEPMMFMAFPEGAALVAVGGAGLPVIKQALEAFRKTPAAPPKTNPKAPQIGLDFSVLRFSRLHTGENDPAFQEAAQEIFKDKDSDTAQDHLQIGLTGEADHARLALEADLSVLRFLIKVGIIQQKGKAEPAR